MVAQLSSRHNNSQRVRSERYRLISTVMDFEEVLDASVPTAAIREE